MIGHTYLLMMIVLYQFRDKSATGCAFDESSIELMEKVAALVLQLRSRYHGFPAQP
jgi:hypothetical protein